MDSPEKTLSRSVSELLIINKTIFGSVRKLKADCDIPPRGFQLEGVGDWVGENINWKF